MASTGRRRRGGRRAVRDILLIGGATLVLALSVKTFVLDAVHVPSASMEPAVLAGDFLFVNKLSYGPATPGHVPFTRISLPVFRLPALSAPRAGDVIVFHVPGSAPASSGTLYVKRIVGLPGELVEGKESRLYVNGAAVRRTPAGVNDAGAAFGPVRVPAAAYFVLGDNLPDSEDSRRWGCVPSENIVGKAFTVYWSVGRGGIRWSRIGTVIH
jgi:signal peptidase I